MLRFVNSLEAHPSCYRPKSNLQCEAIGSGFPKMHPPTLMGMCSLLQTKFWGTTVLMHNCALSPLSRMRILSNRFIHLPEMLLEEFLELIL